MAVTRGSECAIDSITGYLRRQYCCFLCHGPPALFTAELKNMLNSVAQIGRNVTFFPRLSLSSSPTEPLDLLLLCHCFCGFYLWSSSGVDFIYFIYFTFIYYIYFSLFFIYFFTEMVAFLFPKKSIRSDGGNRAAKIFSPYPIVYGRQTCQKIKNKFRLSLH